MSKKIKLSLANTAFKDPMIVSVAAEPGGGQLDKEEHLPPIGNECKVLHVPLYSSVCCACVFEIDYYAHTIMR